MATRTITRTKSQPKSSFASSLTGKKVGKKLFKKRVKKTEAEKAYAEQIKYVAAQAARPSRAERFQAKSVYDNCIDCGENLRKWGPEGSVCGRICPPCASVRNKADRDARKAVPLQQGVLITTDGERRLVLLSDISTALGGGATCRLYHQAGAIKNRPLFPCYDAFIRDSAIHESLSAGLASNPVGLHVIDALSCFDERSRESLYGGVVITGVSGQSLLPNEIVRIMHL